MIFWKRFLYMTTILTATLLICTGCGSARKEAQETYREQGIAYLESGDYENALKAFQNALDQALGEIGEMELDICFYKAKAQYLSGDEDGALETYSAIIAYNNNSKAYYLRGNLYLAKSRVKAQRVDESSDEPSAAEYLSMALSDYESAVKYEKSDYDLYIGIYDSLVAYDKEEKAEEYLSKALEIFGNSAYDKMKKGWITFLLGENEQAVTLLKEAVEGQELESHYCLAEVYLAMGDTENATLSMNAYISSGIADSYKLYSIAEAQIGRGNYEMAVTCLEAARKLETVPNNQTVMKTLVIAYEQMNDFASARNILTEYVALYPDDEEAARELTFLETR